MPWTEYSPSPANWTLCKNGRLCPLLGLAAIELMSVDVSISYNKTTGSVGMCVDTAGGGEAVGRLSIIRSDISLEKVAGMESWGMGLMMLIHR